MCNNIQLVLYLIQIRNENLFIHSKRKGSNFLFEEEIETNDENTKCYKIFLKSFKFKKSLKFVLTQTSISGPWYRFPSKTSGAA